MRKAALIFEKTINARTSISAFLLLGSVVLAVLAVAVYVIVYLYNQADEPDHLRSRLLNEIGVKRRRKMSTIFENQQKNYSRLNEFQQNGTLDKMTEVINNGTCKENGVNVEEDKTSYVKEIFQHMVQKNSHDRVLEKLEVIFAGNGRFVGELVIQPEHTNVYGFLHGGFTATLIDICTSIAMSTHPRKGNGVSVDLNVSYLNPGPLNERVVVTANTIKVGRTLGFSEAVITNKATGDIIAKGSHTKFVGNSDKYELKQ